MTVRTPNPPPTRPARSTRDPGPAGRQGRVRTGPAAALTVLVVLAALAVLAVGVTVPGAQAAAPGGDAGTGSRPLALTTSGPVRGVHDGTVDRYRGIPYAAPPVGDARWKGPRPAGSWLLPRDADTSASPCPQLAEGKPLPEADEDCLYLDVTVPSGARDSGTRISEARSGSRPDPKPVMVWLHGGSNTTGSGSEFDPRRMARIGDVVVVTVNYRLGALGFFGYDGLPGSGSFGLRDQQAALRWVRQNAVFFGGDPSNVTLFGESAGGVDTCAQLTSPAARGLFDRAILQSGSCATRVPSSPTGEDVAISHDDFWTPVDQLRRTGREVAAELGCAPEQPDPPGAGSAEARREVLACLRELPVRKLLPYEFAFGIASGTATLPENPATAIADGRFHRVPVLSGNTRDEARYTTMLLEYATGPITESRYHALLDRAFGPDAGTVRRAYPAGAYESPALAFAAMDTDRVFACPQLSTNRQLASEVPTYGYEFGDRTAPTYAPFLTDLPPGAAHASELAYLFDLALGPWGPNFEQVELTDRQRALGDEMIRAWTRFARTGDPAAGPGSWPRFDTGERPYVRSFAPEDPKPSGGAVDAWAEHHCGLWSDLRADP